MTDQKPSKQKTDSSISGTHPRVSRTHAPQTPTTPVDESVLFEPKRAPSPPPTVGSDEPEADAQHEKTLDIDSALKEDTSSTDVPVVVVSPLVAPPHKQTPSISPESAQEKQKSDGASSLTPEATPTATQHIQEQAAPLSPIRMPRSFASITPIAMQTPVEPVLPESQTPAKAGTPGVASSPEELHAPIPIVQEIPGSPTPPPGTVTKQPSMPEELVIKEKLEEQKKLSVLEQLRAQTASVLHPLRTYQTDAQVHIRESNESLVSAAAAEESRKARAQLVVRPAFKAVVDAAPRHHYTRTVLLVLGIALFLAAGVGAVAYVLIPKTVDIQNQQLVTMHPIEVDESVELQFGGLTHEQLLQLLSDLRDKTGLSLGLVREIYFTLPTDTGGKRLATVDEVLPRLAPHAPQELLRTLDAPFLVGVHVYDGNQGFIILKTNAYEQAYSAMLEWEPTMRQDLLPFLDRREGPKLVSEIVPTTTPPKVINSAFVDAVLKNHDTRALYNDVGDVIFLYSFLDRNTIIIATNDRTLGEALLRVSR